MSSTEEDQQPEEKKLKLANKNDPFYLFDYDREAYLKKLYDFSTKEGDDFDSGDEEERDFTEEEAKLYYDAIAASGGFDVPDFPKEVNFCGMIIPLPVDEHTLEKLQLLSVAAINTFNDYNGTNYKVVQVEKAMHRTSCGINYYITFQAKIDDNNSDALKSNDDNSVTATTFEALVLKGIPKKKGENATEDIKVGKVSSHSSFEIVAPEETLESDDGDGSVEKEVEESEDEEGESVEDDAEAVFYPWFVAFLSILRVEIGAAEQKPQNDDEEGGSVEEKAEGKKMDEFVSE
ncbi:hypothetical protein PTKIN_Ptkin19aG0072500 [Pterospermum kingtungense]